MADDHMQDNQDWLVPALLVAVIIVLAAIIGIVIGVRSASGANDSASDEFERWTKCLRSEGANVPLVEKMRDGGFRITVDGSLVEEGLDREALDVALDSCRDDAPEGIRQFMDIVEGLDDLSPGGFDFGTFDSDLDPGRFFGEPHDGSDLPGIDDHELEQLCRWLATGRVDLEDLDPDVVELCN